MLKRKVLPLGAIAANCIVLWNEGETACWIVDPGQDADDLIAFLDANGLVPALVALTHGHFDHIGAVPGLLAKWPEMPVHIGPGDVPMLGHPQNAWPPDYPLAPRPATLVADLVEGATLTAGGLSAMVLSTPGHTPGSVCLNFTAHDLLLTGDTLFAGSCGRTDFPGGSMAQMKASLRRLAALPAQTAVIAGHGAPTSIGREAESNPFMV